MVHGLALCVLEACLAQRPTWGSCLWRSHARVSCLRWVVGGGEAAVGLLGSQLGLR